MLEAIGAELKAAREGRNITLRQMADDTRISLRHLENLEQGRFKELPGGIYNRAILRSYCEFVGIDPMNMLERYETALNPPTEKGTRTKPRVFLTVNEESKANPIILWSFMLLVSVAGLYISRPWISEIFSPYFSRPSAPARLAAPRAEGPALPPAGNASQTAVPGDPAFTEALSSASAQRASRPEEKSASVRSPLRLEFEVSEKTWVSVNSDGNRVLVKLLEPGDKQAFDAAERFYVILGNAAGVRLRVNGKLLQPLGRSGDVVRVLITEKNLPDLLEKPDR